MKFRTFSSSFFGECSFVFLFLGLRRCASHPVEDSLPLWMHGHARIPSRRKEDCIHACDKIPSQLRNNTSENILVHSLTRSSHSLALHKVFFLMISEEDLRCRTDKVVKFMAVGFC